MTLNEIVDNLEDIQDMRDEIRRRAMVYQAERKEEAAKRDGKPADYYYYLSYQEWVAIRDR